MDKAKEQERELLESRSQQMRKYLMDKVIAVLAEGVLKICKEQPNDPIEYLVLLTNYYFHIVRFYGQKID